MTFSSREGPSFRQECTNSCKPLLDPPDKPSGSNAAQPSLTERGTPSVTVLTVPEVQASVSWLNAISLDLISPECPEPGSLPLFTDG